MAYQYSVGGAAPGMASASPPIQRSRTPVQPMSQQQIQPGSLTYTTSTGPDGQVIYHPFKAVPASYQTPQGIVSGIQWIPAEATSVVPVGATPADDSFHASFSRRYGDDRRDDDRRREEDRRRRKEEEREARREEKERRRQEKEEDREFRRAREREDRARRNSAYGYDNLDRQFGEMDVKDRAYATGGTPYTAGYAAPGYATPGAYAAPTSAYGAAPQRPVSPYQGAPIAPRPISPYAAPPGAMPRAPSPYAPPPATGIARAASPYGPPGGIARAASPYGPPGGIARAASPYGPPPASGIARAASPYGGVPGSGVYPPGHVMEGKPMPQPVRPISRAASPVPPVPGAVYPPGSGYATPAAGAYGYGGAQAAYGSAAQAGAQYAVAPYPAGASPMMPTGDQQMLAAPEGFSRPPNLAQSYTRFETFKIQDMDGFYENIPKMPLVLQQHDVYHEDWIRIMTDLSLAWSGKLPVPEYSADGRTPKRTVLTADLIDLWNSSFFLKRGVEVVLFKGRERRSGRSAGTVELHLPGFDDIRDVSDTDSSSESESDSEDDDYERGRYGAYGGVYGRQVPPQMAELAEARRLRREKKKAEKKKRRQEKKQRRKQKEAERIYALYVTCVPREF